MDTVYIDVSYIKIIFPKNIKIFQKDISKLDNNLSK